MLGVYAVSNFVWVSVYVCLFMYGKAVKALCMARQLKLLYVMSKY